MSDPEAIVQQQVNAYNNHDIEAFVATYSPNVRILKLSDNEIILSGMEALRELYSERFQHPNLRGEIAQRMALGDFVIDFERVSGVIEGEIVEAIAIYEVQDDLIQRVWFILA